MMIPFSRSWLAEKPEQADIEKVALSEMAMGRCFDSGESKEWHAFERT